MELKISVTPILNKNVKTEKEWIKMLKKTLSREFGIADLDGIDLVIKKTTKKKKKKRKFNKILVEKADACWPI
jgi:hypothetical protein